MRNKHVYLYFHSFVRLQFTRRMYVRMCPPIQILSHVIFNIVREFNDGDFHTEVCEINVCQRTLARPANCFTILFYDFMQLSSVTSNLKTPSFDVPSLPCFVVDVNASSCSALSSDAALCDAALRFVLIIMVDTCLSNCITRFILSEQVCTTLLNLLHLC